jgi:hypothetical protein
MDGISLVRSLMEYNHYKSSEITISLQTAASRVYVLMTDLSGLFLRRRRAVSLKKRKKSHHGPRWSDYLLRRLPLDVEFRHLHFLLQPGNVSLPGNFNETVNATKDTHSRECKLDGEKESMVE